MTTHPKPAEMQRSFDLQPDETAWCANAGLLNRRVGKETVPSVTEGFDECDCGLGAFLQFARSVGEERVGGQGLRVMGGSCR